VIKRSINPFLSPSSSSPKVAQECMKVFPIRLALLASTIVTFLSTFFCGLLLFFCVPFFFSYTLSYILVLLLRLFVFVAIIDFI